MTMVKTSITISEDIFSQAKDLSGNFSSVVSDALREYIRKKNIEKAKNSFGKWKNRGKDSVAIVDELRSDIGRDYVNRDN